MLRRAILVLVVVAAIGGACGIEPGSGQCRETTLLADPVTVTDPLAPLTLTATLTSEGKPVAGADISFATLTTGTPNLPAGARGGRHIGKATTGDNGVARYVREEGIDGLLLPGEQLTGYQAGFTPLRKIDGVQYCKARDDAPMTI